jgi:hypothetical protein
VGQDRPEALALEQLRDDVRGAIVGADVVKGEDVRVVQGGDGAGLELEALEAVGVPGDIVVEDLEGNVATETRVSCAVDLAHAACSEELDDLVRPETGMRRSSRVLDPMIRLSAGGAMSRLDHGSPRFFRRYLGSFRYAIG